MFQNRIRIVRTLLMTLCLFIGSYAAAGAVITYHGRILDSADRPVESNSVTFRIRIYSPNPAKCLLYEESRTVSMLASNGVFVIPIGDGVGTRSSNDPGIVLEKIFSNDPSFTFNTTNTPKLVCNSGTTYTPDPLHQRQLAVFFDDHSGAGEQTLPVADINFVPLAVSSYDSQNIGGVPASSVLRVNGGAATALTPAYFTELIALITGTSTQYEKVGKLKGVTVPTLTNGQVLGWSGGAWSAITPMTSYTETDPSVKAFAKANLPACGANQFLQNDGSGNLVCTTAAGGGGTGTVTSVAAGTGLLTDQTGNAAVTGSGTLSVNVGTSANQIVQMGSDAKLPAVDGSKLTNVAAATATTASGLTSTATINTSGNITTTGTLTAATSSNTNIYTDNLYVRSPAAGGNSIRITGPTTAIASNYVLKLPEGLPATGTTRVLASDDAGNLSWSSQGAGSVTTVTADAPIVIDSTAASAPKVTLPKATASADGYLDKADFATFNGKQAAGNYIVTLQGDVTSSNFTSGTVDVAVNKIKGTPVSATPTLAGQVLRYESGNYTPAFVSMLDLRSKVTGALALSTSCAANKTLTFNSATDSLKCEDISITKSQISDLGTIGTLAAKNTASLTADVTGVLPVANGGTNSSVTLNNNRIMASSGGAIVEAAAITSNRALVSSSSGLPIASPVTDTELGYVSGVTSSLQTQLNGKVGTTDLANYALLAGRSGGQVLAGGTGANDNLTLQSTSATNKGYVLLNPTAGKVAVGSTTPVSTFHVNGITSDGSFGPADGVLVTGGSWPGLMSSMYMAYGGKYSTNSTLGAQFGLIGVNVKYNATTDTLERQGVDSSRNSSMAISMNPYNAQSGGYRMGFWTGDDANPTERLSITGAGKVGIGTTTPSYALSVNGTIYGNNGYILENGTASSAGPAISFWKHRNYAATQDGDELGFLSFIGHDGTGLYRSASITSYAEGAPTSATHTVPGAIVFSTTSSGSDVTEKMRITSAGKVGIGTSSPSTKLHVAGGASTFHDSTGANSGQTVYIANSTTAGTNYSLVANTVGVGAANNTGVYINVYGATSANMGLRIVNPTAASGNYAIYSDATAQSYFAGNVGIGNTTPTSRLDVVRNFSGETNTTAGFIGGTDSGTANTGAYFVQKDGVGLASPGTRLFNVVSNGVSKLVVDGGGNVGIGNVTPSYPLDVAGQARFTGGYTTSDARYKRNIASLENSLDEILRLRGVSYDFRVDEFPKKGFSSGPQVGLIAQEVEKVYPQVVDTDRDGFKSVNYQALISPVIEAIKELYHKFLDQQQESKAQKALIQEQAQKIKELEARLEKIEKNLAK